MIVNKGNKRYKHLTQDDRNILEIMLQNATTFQTIAAALGKDACTISREVRCRITIHVLHIENMKSEIPL